MATPTKVDTESLISAIESRPFLWDFRVKDYAYSTKKKEAWREVSRELVENYKDSKRERKRLIEMDLQKRWKGLRNSFAREVHKQNVEIAGLVPEEDITRRKYIFFNRLSFLLPVTSSRNKSKQATVTPSTTSCTSDQKETKQDDTAQIDSLVTSELQPYITSLLESQSSSLLKLQVASQLEPQVTSQLEPQVTSQLEPQVTSQLEPQVTSQLEPQVTSQLESQVTSQLEPQVTSHVNVQISYLKPQVTSQLKPQITSSLKPQVTSQLKPQVTSQLKPQVLSQPKPQASSQSNPQVASQPPKPRLALQQTLQPQVIFQQFHSQEQNGHQNQSGGLLIRPLSNGNDEQDSMNRICHVLTESLHQKNMMDDEDRQFFLSLVTDFKNIPSQLKLDAKLETINILRKYRAHTVLRPSLNLSIPSNASHVYSSNSNHPCNIPQTALPHQQYNNSLLPQQRIMNPLPPNSVRLPNSQNISQSLYETTDEDIGDNE